MAVDLTASYGGVKIKNPIFGSSSPVSQQPDICQRASEAGAAALVLKTSFMETPDLRLVGHPQYAVGDITGLEPWRPVPPKKSDPVIRGKKGKARPGYTMNLIMLSFPVSSFWIGDDYITHFNEVTKAVSEDCLIIPSIYAVTLKEWENQLRRVEKMKAKVVHLNLACPIVAGWEPLPPELKELKPYEPPAANTEVATRITKFCVDHIDIPVVVKFHPFSFANVDTALALQKVGAQGIELADSHTGPMIRIDPDTATPGWDGDYPGTGGGWGPWIIPSICGQIYRMKKAGVTIDIAATGGIMTAKDIARYIMAGASSVGSARSIMVEGWGLATEWLDDLEQFMKEKGYNSLEEMKGIVIDKVITDPSTVLREMPQIIGGPRPSKEIALNEAKCIGCRWCAAACMHCAIDMVDELPSFNRDKCEVCGMCEAVCPVGALSIERRK